MVNIGDVARELGVSRSTVSYALSGKRAVSADMRRRVEEAIAELDFVPSERARALAHSRSDTLALLLPMGPDATPSITLQFVHGAAQASQRRGRELLLVVGDEPVGDLDRLLRSDRTDGVIVLDVTEDDLRLSRVSAAGKPAVLLGWPSAATQIDCVDLDWEATGRLLVEHVAGLGHRVVGVLGVASAAFDRHLTYAERFRAGAQGAAVAGGVTLVDWASPAAVSGAVDALLALFADHPDITALVIQNEALMPHVHALAAHLGLRVPGDISVVGVGLDTLGSVMLRPVSGVDNPSARLTDAAVDMLATRIDAQAPLPPRRLMVTPTFTDRGSTARL